MNIVEGAVGLVRSVFTPASDFSSARMDICKSCDKFNSKTQRCSLCGCWMEAKTKLADKHCPIGKW